MARPGLLDQLPALSGQPRAQRRQAGDLRRPQGAAATRILGATWQRCRVHFMRNLLAHTGRQGRGIVSAFVATAFAQNNADSAQWRQVADRLRCRRDDGRGRCPGLHDLPGRTSDMLHSTNPLEHLHSEIKRRTNLVSTFPNEDAVTRLMGEILLELNGSSREPDT